MSARKRLPTLVRAGKTLLRAGNPPGSWKNPPGSWKKPSASVVQPGGPTRWSFQLYSCYPVVQPVLVRGLPACSSSPEVQLSCPGAYAPPHGDVEVQAMKHVGQTNGGDGDLAGQQRCRGGMRREN